MTASGDLWPGSTSREGRGGICSVFFRSIFFREILEAWGDWGLGEGSVSGVDICLKLGLSGGETEMDLFEETVTELTSPSQEEVLLTFFFLAKVVDK